MKNNKRDYDQELLNSTYGGSQKVDWWGYVEVGVVALLLAYVVAHVVAFVNSAVV